MAYSSGRPSKSTEVASALIAVSRRVARRINGSAIDSHVSCDAELSPISMSWDGSAGDQWPAGAPLTNSDFISAPRPLTNLESLGDNRTQCDGGRPHARYTAKCIRCSLSTCPATPPSTSPVERKEKNHKRRLREARAPRTPRTRPSAWPPNVEQAFLAANNIGSD